VLLRQWLQTCDNKRQCDSVERSWPTRVVFVGPPDSKLELWETESKESRLTGTGGYLALSHRWGGPTDDDKKKFCTTAENYECRKAGFLESDLPKTFRDAVQVTRELGMQYLWIDALCIIQSISGEDSKDWEDEAPLMARVFNSAYCTLAASSAMNWEEGFLAPRHIRYDKGRTTFGKPRYICRGPVPPQTFEHDVDASPLQKRAWVLQERVLSRRTLHFTAHYTYFECGDGVRCENLVKLQSRPLRQYFLLDPRFPERLNKSGYTRTVDFVQRLFEVYAKSQLTNESDRTVAILSLMDRMKHVFKTEHRYGIFECFRFRLLMWRHCPEADDSQGVMDDRQFPSWSWMTYSRIIFLEAESLEVPNDAALEFLHERQGVLSVRVRELRNCTSEQLGRDHAILDANSKDAGILWFDTIAPTNITSLKCVIIARERGRWFYILLVEGMPREQSYKRVGVGRIEASCVSESYWDGELF
ncbi:HET-domain-containing protein, partial [Trichodelitschia bisporula]